MKNTSKHELYISNSFTGHNIYLYFICTKKFWRWRNINKMSTHKHHGHLHNGNHKKRDCMWVRTEPFSVTSNIRGSLLIEGSTGLSAFQLTSFLLLCMFRPFFAFSLTHFLSIPQVTQKRGLSTGSFSVRWKVNRVVVDNDCMHNAFKSPPPLTSPQV